MISPSTRTNTLRLIADLVLQGRLFGVVLGFQGRQHLMPLRVGGRQRRERSLLGPPRGRNVAQKLQGPHPLRSDQLGQRLRLGAPAPILTAVRGKRARPDHHLRRTPAEMRQVGSIAPNEPQCTSL